MDTKVEKWLSPQRFGRYLRAADDDPDLALAIYDWNLRLSSCCFEAIADFEVLLRNVIDEAMHDGSPDEELGWLLDEDLLNEQTILEVNDTQARVSGENRTVTRHQVVAGLSFGFWTALFFNGYENLWRSHTRHAFPHGNGNRRQVLRELNSLRFFRNRIAHHEPIFDRDLHKPLQRCIRVAALIDPDAATWLASRHSLHHVLVQDPRVAGP